MSDCRIRIVVVDDSSLFRHLIRDILREIPGCSVVGNAENGNRAIEIITERKPDLVTLDVEMPDKNGIEVLREMKRCQSTTKAIMVSRLTDAGARVTTDALMEGAFDFVLKPSGSNPEQNRATLTATLKEKITAFRHSKKEQLAQEPQDEFADADSTQVGHYDAVLIGTSTGGPEALRTVLPKLPSSFPLPVLVVQHMPPQYTGKLAERLNELCALEVVEAKDAMPVRAGTIYIAPGGRHMKVTSRNRAPIVQLTDDPPEHSCRPAVDYLFRSAGDVWGGRTIGVIMTGMGQDGTEGCLLLKQMGGYIIAQDADSCVVYGMPKSVVDNDLCNRVVQLKSIPSAIVHRARRG